jgi:two-component system, chemotaxis family, protein-glutamate methylesterase/glutaminase
LDKLKVLVADDTVIYRKILTQAVEATGFGSVVRTASNGNIALEWLNQDSDIDVILLDAFMPELDGIATLKEVRKCFPEIEAIMISGESSSSAEVTVKALAMGAVDFILKPSGDNSEKNMEKIVNQLKGIFAQIKIKKYTGMNGSASHNHKPLKTSDKAAGAAIFAEKLKTVTPILPTVDLVLIASSTGGPSALEAVLTGLPQNFRKPILIVQHMPPQFTRVLAENLDKKSQISIKEGTSGDMVENGKAIIAPGGMHMIVDSSPGQSKIIKLDDSPYVNGVKPAADILFQSVAKAYKGCNILAVILTGMGIDGKQGIAEIKRQCNCYCISQSESTCVVYGMPRSVHEAGLSDETVDLKDISTRISQISSFRS